MLSFVDAPDSRSFETTAACRCAVVPVSSVALLVVTVGDSRFTRRKSDLELSSLTSTDEAVRAVQQLLVARNYLPEYYL